MPAGLDQNRKSVIKSHRRKNIVPNYFPLSDNRDWSHSLHNFGKIILSGCHGILFVTSIKEKKQIKLKKYKQVNNTTELVSPMRVFGNSIFYLVQYFNYIDLL